MPPSIRAPRVPSADAGWRAAVVVVLAGVLLAAACGKKGPPLAPVVRTPAPMSDFTVRRSGDIVYLRVTVPTTNTDATAPADLSRIEIYAYTAVKEVEGIEPRDMTLVSSITVRRPPDPEKEREAREKAPPPAATKPKPAAPPKPDTSPKPDTPAKTGISPKPDAPPKPVTPPKPAKPPEPGVDQGSVVTLTDTLTPESMKLTRLPRRLVPPPIVQADRPEQGSKLEVPNLGPVLESKPRRFYLAYAVNRSGIRGLASARFAVAFDVLPPPPGTPRLEVKARTLQISWDPPAGAASAIDRPSTEPALPVTTRGTLLPVLPSYNIYLVSRPPATVPGHAASVRPPEMPLPLNAKPLTSPSFVDDDVEFGVERCYQVRTVNTVGATAQLATGATAASATAAGVPATPAISESAPSAIACVTPADTVPPPAPTSLAAVASSGAISLIWTGVEVADLAGYLVLRSASPDGPFTPLFTQPIRETTYRDADLKPGTTYVYAVVAVDSATPPNRSPMSNTASETAR